MLLQNTIAVLSELKIERERERENNACSKFRTIDPFGHLLTTTILSNLATLLRSRKQRCLNLIASNKNKVDASKQPVVIRFQLTASHTDKHTQYTQREIVKQGSSNFYKLHIFYKKNSVQVEAKGLNQMRM